MICVRLALQTKAKAWLPAFNIKQETALIPQPLYGLSCPAGFQEVRYILQKGIWRALGTRNFSWQPTTTALIVLARRKLSNGEEVLIGSLPDHTVMLNHGAGPTIPTQMVLLGTAGNMVKPFAWREEKEKRHGLFAEHRCERDEAPRAQLELNNLPESEFFLWPAHVIKPWARAEPEECVVCQKHPASQYLFCPREDASCAVHVVICENCSVLSCPVCKHVPTSRTQVSYEPFSEK